MTGRCVTGVRCLMNVMCHVMTFVFCVSLAISMKAAKFKYVEYNIVPAVVSNLVCIMYQVRRIIAQFDTRPTCRFRLPLQLRRPPSPREVYREASTAPPTPPPPPVSAYSPPRSAHLLYTLRSSYPFLLCSGRLASYPPPPSPPVPT